MLSGVILSQTESKTLQDYRKKEKDVSEDEEMTEESIHKKTNYHGV